MSSVSLKKHNLLNQAGYASSVSTVSIRRDVICVALLSLDGAQGAFSFTQER